jgi:hypothetical protein
MRENITALFFCIDEFCKSYEEWEKHRLINTGKTRYRSGEMSLSEMLTIMVLFHFSPCKNFKYFYISYLIHFHKQDFPTLVSYSRFVQLMPRFFVPFCILLQSLFGEKTGTYIADATSLPVCHNKRISRNRVFKGLAARGKTTMGWFYGLKLHLIINHKGSIVAVKITPGNVDERTVLELISQNLKGNLFADKGFISKELFKKLYQRGLKLITGIKRNMKNHLMPLIEKLLLRKRFIIETVFDILKVHMNLSHTRHRSPINCCVNILSCLTAYQLKENKPTFSSRSVLIQN